MERKEGDEKGIGLIKDRVINDLQVMEMARKMYGIEKLELYNAHEISTADTFTYPYERTYSFTHTVKDGKVTSEQAEYIVTNHGRQYYSMLPPYVVVTLIKGLAKMFGLTKK
jgi:hypothetical protein